MIKQFVFRNSTIEPFFQSNGVSYSGYGDITLIPNSDFYIWAYNFPLIINEKKTTQQIDVIQEKLNLVLSKIKNNKTFIIFSMHKLSIPICEKVNINVEHAVQAYNNHIRALEKKSRYIKVFEISELLDQYSLDDIIDWKYYYLSSIAYNPKLGRHFRSWFNNNISTILGRRKKCLVIDADNTLWGGVIGEDGMAGIKLGGEYPGNCFKEFQEVIREMFNHGVILVLNSKNNQQDVEEVLQSHPDQILKKEMFTSLKINWTNKAENIITISDELNIGLDSIVFIDDNPKEREIVAKTLPEVIVPDFPTENYELRKFATEIFNTHFPIYKMTTEDINKNIHYEAKKKREGLEKASFSYQDYIRGLDISLIIEEINPINSARISQMTQKTNQFNLTTKRYTESELHDYKKNNGRIICARVIDKFADNGISVLIMLKKSNNSNAFYIDNFLASCRVLGNGIENIFLHSVLNDLFHSDIKTVFARYNKTKRNTQAYEYYEKQNFELIEISKDQATKLYKKSLTKLIKQNKDYKIEWR